MTSRRSPARFVAYLAVFWLVVAVAAVGWGLGRIEDDLGERTAAALAAAGLEGADVSIDGRDVTVVADSGEEAGVLAAVDGLEGVRDVRFEPRLAAGDEPTEPTVLGTVIEQTTTTTTPPTSTTTTATTTTTTTTTTITVPAPTAPVIEATLDGGSFRLTGVVPDEATAAALVTAANVAYAPFVETDVAVSPDVEFEPWLAGAPTGISLLPMITDGTIRVEGGEVQLSGRSPNPEYLAAFEAAVAATLGVDSVATDVEITNLAAPRFTADMSAGTLTLGGTLPSEEIRQVIVGGAVAAYGAEAVVDETAVGEGLYTSFWMYTMPGVFQLFRPFPTYELLVEDGVTSGALRGGASFPFGSAELTPELQEILGIGAAILSRDISLGTAVEGHTDSVGPTDFNQRLSEQRAQAAIDFLVASGIAPERLVGRGFGETRPAVPNDTPENRARNRRAEFVFGPVAEITAGH